MKVNEYKVLAMCIEIGVQLGWNRAHKHSDTPEPNYIMSCIEDAVTNELFEYFEFDDDGDATPAETGNLG